MRFAYLCLVVPSFLALPALAQHGGDIGLTLVPTGTETARIETNLLAAKGGPVPGVRVFASEMGEAGVPHATDEPGFDAEDGTFWPGTRLTFACPDGLMLFTGDGVATATAERMSISYLSLVRSVGSGPVEGFPLFVSPEGGWHRHFVFEATRADGGLPQPAIYVLPMTLSSDQPGVEPTAEFFLVFNDGMGEAEHDAAIAWVDANLAGGNTCAADLNQDGSVGGGDLTMLLSGWGDAGGPADLDGNGIVGASDLTAMLAAWGEC